ncbi:Frag1/DRAM/Sfk1 [Penicillium nucicola]|uniref:Frag1/DRAM/Sfk1 n=1 Tax=Penicillium nucicola TaxID=1850975 RepID=UPI00254598A4|nr:Frag1/DRAM/Sfk1 [Penicillium nucicola]KAJ5758127.1 Frag1/DRAM/Sfk1 [Penicillium nucicola]
MSLFSPPPPWVFPTISASTWLAMLLAMLGHWTMIGEPRYGLMKPGQNIPFISDIGAQELKPLFMIGCITTVLLLNLSFYQFIQSRGYVNKLCTHASFFFTVIGSTGLILLSVFDNIDHHFTHDVFVTIFIVGYLISAALMCLDYVHLGISHALREPMIFTSFVIKLSFIIVELTLVIVFRVTEAIHYKENNMAATLEWVIAFVFTGYILSFIVDLLPSTQKQLHVEKGYEQLEMAMAYP